MRKLAILTALLAAPLAGCVTTGTTISAKLPPIPAGIVACFNKVVAAPAGKAGLSQKDVVSLVASLRQSEASKSACGRKLIAFYDAEVAGLR